MTSLLAIFAATVSTVAAPADAIVRAKFTPSNADIANPERGFYRAAPANLEQLDRAFFTKAYADGYRLVYTRLDLAPYRTTQLPKAYLSRLERAAGAARAAGVKLIFRAAYNYPASETAYRQAQDAALPMVMQHIDQLKVFFRDQGDVIAFVQAGFVGAWGEWHTSSNKLTEPNARDSIRAKLLDAIPANRFVQFRYPPHLRAWSPTLPGLRDALDSRFRTGFHNDCFLASKTDVGTFSEDPAQSAVERSDMERLGELAPFGGETCNPADAPGSRSRTDCADIMREGASYNLTYLNDGYYRPAFHERWIAQGCSVEVSGRMGYRLRLVEMTHPAQASPGTSFTLRILMVNDGWARLYNPRALVLLLRNRSNGKIARLVVGGADPRAWLPGQASRVVAKVDVPLDLVPADYEVMLALPDESPRLAGDPRYAVRLANADDQAKSQLWNARSGAFATGTVIKIGGRQ